MPYKNKEDRAKRDAERSATILAFLREYKLEKGCVDCGYNEHHAGLQFDHLPEYVKSQNISGMFSRSMSVILEEINKCEVVCATCHAIRSFERGQFNGKR